MTLKLFIHSVLLSIICSFRQSHKINELLVERMSVDEVKQTECERCNIPLTIEFDKDDPDVYWISENC